MSKTPLHDELYDACANHTAIPVSISVSPQFLAELLSEPMSPGVYLAGTDGWKFHGLPLKPHSGVERFEITRGNGRKGKS
jgi:hypothetical protein